MVSLFSLSLSLSLSLSRVGVEITMKLSHLNSSVLRCYPRFSTRNVSGVALCSTTTIQDCFWDRKMRSLYRQMSPTLPSGSIVLVMDHWIEKGQRVNRFDVLLIINDLRY
ncbi:hypothetical protein PanWU01x14_262900 [Parasponia andersonii]|uniref:Uncharacterized protein n=1 Tax=Parasponia andersonii TaxID=3476 RepID=A0A2P5B7Z2_PARAD|nr:hypothetical protein PanWU01x14_262900 [Parasponia andersonii]